MQKYISCFVVMFLSHCGASEPRIQLNFNNWQNNRDSVVQVFSHKGPTPWGVMNYLKVAEYAQITKLTPGYNGSITSIPLKPGLLGFFVAGIRLVPEKYVKDCLQFYFTYFAHEDKSELTIMCTANQKQNENKESGYPVASKELSWQTKNPPAYITIEIEGTLGVSWNDAQVTIKPNLVT
ncbi:MAG: hypothetical protein AMXMBFR12_05440 [Candidatus Babeliales bacterium]